MGLLPSRPDRPLGDPNKGGSPAHKPFFPGKLFAQNSAETWVLGFETGSVRCSSTLCTSTWGSQGLKVAFLGQQTSKHRLFTFSLFTFGAWQFFDSSEPAKLAIVFASFGRRVTRSGGGSLIFFLGGLKLSPGRACLAKVFARYQPPRAGSEFCQEPAGPAGVRGDGDGADWRQDCCHGFAEWVGCCGGWWVVGGVGW